MDAVLKKSSLFYVPSLDIRWGGYRQIEIEMEHFEVSSKKEYDYYHLISESDLSIGNVEKINYFFEKEKDKCFLSLVEEKIKNEIK